MHSVFSSSYHQEFSLYETLIVRVLYPRCKYPDISDSLGLTVARAFVPSNLGFPINTTTRRLPKAEAELFGEASPLPPSHPLHF